MDVDKVYLLTVGDGSDGDEWGVLGIYSTREKAEMKKDEYESPRKRDDGSVYHYEADIEEWTINEDHFWNEETERK